MTEVTKPKSKAGGKRAGAGKPVMSKTIITQRLNQLLAEKVSARFGPMIDAQLDSAMGVLVKRVNKMGETVYDEQAPSTPAAKFLTEQLLGRAKESVEHSGQVMGLVGLITQLNTQQEED